jgi:serine/threonine protein kinase
MASALPLATVIGSYTIARQIGKGGMGRVYLVVRNTDGKNFALKALELAPATDGAADGAANLAQKNQREESIRRFVREARLAAAIHHPNVVRTVGFIRRYPTKPTPHHAALSDYFIIMEYFPRGSLRDYLTSDRRLTPGLVCNVGLAMARALIEAAHIRLVHRDLKPDNIMLAQDGTPKLADLGLATLTHAEVNAVSGTANPGAATTAFSAAPSVAEGDDLSRDSLTRQNFALGTPQYMAPEQILDSHGVDSRSDIYGLGATLYHLLTGVAPFSGKNVREILQKQLREMPLAIATVRRDTPPQLAQVIMKCLAKKPEARYQDAAALATALEGLGLYEAFPPYTADGVKKPTAVFLPPAELAPPPANPAPPVDVQASAPLAKPQNIWLPLLIALIILVLVAILLTAP